MSHASGPWTFGEVTLANPGYDRLVRAADDRIVALVSRNCWDERDANAHLIAAAPDLLTALKALVDATENNDNPRDMGVSSYEPVVERAKAAIAKAEGQ